ncbi:PIG-L family deacetylase [Rubinisphaera italica]|uniref:Mycothiol S-conjugate amidase n=1 Tax=Rubinisphaera italica TaxID=2527969 RepID=A0A5C5XCN5_9PLAN|nr:PIG-L family deacetylase [Rubinisphaera italica]TWT60379.1 Mycothiol S-conjugate amidase [Rubinisphaera italica]
MQELPEPLDVIAVGAHPDDVEIGCGGTLATLSRQGYRVGIIDLTDGEPTPLSPGPEVRLDEARKAAEILGVHVRETLDLPNRKLFDNYEARVTLAKVFRRYRPKVVIGIADKTPLASPDHWQAMQITDAAIFYSRLTKWDDEFDGLPVHTVSRQLWYPLGLRQMPAPQKAGHFITDISDALETKIRAVEAYETQFPPTKAHVYELLRSQSHYYGAAAGFTAGELIISPTVLGVRDMMASLF